MPYADRNRAREYQRQYRRYRRSGDSCTTPGQTQLPEDFRIRAVADILGELEGQIAAVKLDEEAGTLERARVIGYLLQIALRAVEAHDLAGRLEQLERTLKLRKET